MALLFYCDGSVLSYPASLGKLALPSTVAPQVKIMSRMHTPHTHEARARIGEHDAAQPPLRSQAHMHLLLDTGASTVKNSILFTRLWPWVSVCQPCRRWRSREHSVKSQSQGSEVVLNRNNPDVPRQEMPTLIDWPYMR